MRDGTRDKAVYRIITLHSAEETLAYCHGNGGTRIELLFLDIEKGLKGESYSRIMDDSEVKK